MKPFSRGEPGSLGPWFGVDSLIGNFVKTKVYVLVEVLKGYQPKDIERYVYYVGVDSFQVGK